MTFLSLIGSLCAFLCIGLPFSILLALNLEDWVNDWRAEHGHKP